MNCLTYPKSDLHKKYAEQNIKYIRLLYEKSKEKNLS